MNHRIVSEPPIKITPSLMFVKKGNLISQELNIPAPLCIARVPHLFEKKLVGLSQIPSTPVQRSPPSLLSTTSSSDLGGENSIYLDPERARNSSGELERAKTPNIVEIDPALVSEIVDEDSFLGDSVTQSALLDEIDQMDLGISGDSLQSL